MTTRAIRGQSLTETAVLITCVITGLVFMRIYVQRAIQGGLFGATSSLGMQFDPRDPYRERQTLSSSDTVRLVSAVSDTGVAGMVGAELMGGKLHGGDASLPDLPVGPVYREPALQSTEVGGNWRVETTPDTYYCEQRKTGGCP